MSPAAHCIPHGVVGQTVVHGSLRFHALFNVSRTGSLPGDDVGPVSGAVRAPRLLLVTRLSLVPLLKALPLDVPACNNLSAAD